MCRNLETYILWLSFHQAVVPAIFPCSKSIILCHLVLSRTAAATLCLRGCRSFLLLRLLLLRTVSSLFLRGSGGGDSTLVGKLTLPLHKEAVQR